ncbi:MAG: hypothetical protein AAGA25_07855 [Planctomycetota bacterium]
MKINFPRWTALSTLALMLSVVGVMSWAQRGPGGDGEGFGPREGGPPMVEGDREGREGRDRDRRGPRMSDEDLEAAYEIVVRLYPKMAEKLEAQREEDPEKFKKTLERSFPRMRFLVQLQKRDPEMFELRIQDISLDQQAKQLVKQLREARKADDKGRYKELYEQLETKVAEQFDVRQQIRAMEIEALKQKLEELEQSLDDRDDDRKDLIEQRINELAGPEW